MKDEKRAARRRKIEAAAYEVLAEKGYKATSMLAVAKRASASNETLYNWYGNKQTLFRSMVEANAHDAASLLKHCLESDADPCETIKQIGPLVLSIVTGEKAIALNRAAAGDVHETGQLGETIANGGKRTIVPMLARIFDRAKSADQMRFDDALVVADIYVRLLIGDIQIERVIGVRKALDDEEIRNRSNQAFGLILRLYGAG